jgi:hypothetical protein
MGMKKPIFDFLTFLKIRPIYNTDFFLHIFSSVRPHKDENWELIPIISYFKIAKPIIKIIKMNLLKLFLRRQRPR